MEYLAIIGGMGIAAWIFQALDGACESWRLARKVIEETERELSDGQA